MGRRHQARLLAVQFLFQRDFNSDDLESSLDLFFKMTRPSASAKSYAEELIRGVVAEQAKLDSIIRKHAQNWDLERMGAVDRNIMRVALYEILFRPDVPPVVSINEAVELAKELSGLESGRFVNGILDRARKDIDRPPRTPQTVKR